MQNTARWCSDWFWYINRCLWANIYLDPLVTKSCFWYINLLFLIRIDVLEIQFLFGNGKSFWTWSRKWNSLMRECSTARPWDTRPQEVRTLEIHGFELGPKTLEIHGFWPKALQIHGFNYVKKICLFIVFKSTLLYGAIQLYSWDTFEIEKKP